MLMVESCVKSAKDDDESRTGLDLYHNLSDSDDFFVFNWDEWFQDAIDMTNKKSFD